MARIFQTGFEIGVVVDASGTLYTPDGYTGGSSILVSSTYARTGSKSLKVEPGSPNYAHSVKFPSTNTDYYAQFYMRRGSSPSTLSVFLYFRNADTDATWGTLRMNTSGQIGLYNSAGTLVGSLSSAISDSGWDRIAVRRWTDGGNTNATLRVNGTELGSGIVYASNVSSSDGMTFSAPASSGILFYVDDLVVNDASGSVNNSWVGDERVVLVLPESDNTDFTTEWTGGAGGTTNLYDAVNNTPPIGTAAETNLTQIEQASAGGATVQDQARFNGSTLASLGVTAANKVIAAQVWVCHGEDIKTGTKTGEARFYYDGVGTTVDALTASFNFGNDVNALGTYPTDWAWSTAIDDVFTTAPPVSTAPLLYVHKTDAGTRVASCCFLGAYVSYMQRSLPMCPPAIDYMPLLVR